MMCVTINRIEQLISQIEFLCWLYSFKLGVINEEFGSMHECNKKAQSIAIHDYVDSVVHI